jgi:hypothetical protein
MEHFSSNSCIECNDSVGKPLGLQKSLTPNFWLSLVKSRVNADRAKMLVLRSGAVYQEKMTLIGSYSLLWKRKNKIHFKFWKDIDKDEYKANKQKRNASMD